MPAVPTTADWIDGDALSATNLNARLASVLKFLLARPAAAVRQTVAQTLTTATWTPIQFGVEDFDVDVDGIGGHSTASNTSRYTARYPGIYLCSGGVGFANNATGLRGTRWARNGIELPGTSTFEGPSGNLSAYAARAWLIALDVGDYAELQGYQASGGNLATVISGSDLQSSMAVSWIRSL